MTAGWGRTLAGLALVGVSLGPLAPLAAQAPSGGPEGGTLVAVVAAVARVLGGDAATIRVVVQGDLPTAADSVEVSPGTTDRWMLTLWSGDRATRRLARVGRVRSVPVATRPLARGETVAAEHVAAEQRVVWEPSQPTATDPVGLVTTRVVAAGQPLVPPAVRAPLLFKGGDTIEALLVQAGVTMRVRAEALSSARAGDSIYVRLASGKRMEARAVERGLVHLIAGGT